MSVEVFGPLFNSDDRTIPIIFGIRFYVMLIDMDDTEFWAFHHAAPSISILFLYNAHESSCGDPVPRR